MELSLVSVSDIFISSPPELYSGKEIFVMDTCSNDLLDYLDDEDYEGAHEYAERHACESDVCAEYLKKDDEEIDEFYRSGCDRREHEAGNPDNW